jgi:hypothetical protein
MVGSGLAHIRFRNSAPRNLFPESGKNSKIQWLLRGIPWRREPAIGRIAPAATRKIRLSLQCPETAGGEIRSFFTGRITAGYLS